ncbi:DUF5990 family protein [Mycobacterium sp. ITM-2016-00318]|uniref:DUF5990 family protein n=1 Tax=Mycobacterium sp. ITM-2016-00318 TaxID=2099693 RepID=UPI0026D4118F|nr:DUF5990 family protein [Mycobacterium sp. ITM-2016-00318]WNG93485.1 DUF5990 family protein [Mycobacterium sp. ITM-2016-00318]
MNAPKSLVDDNGWVQIRIVGTDLPGRDCPSGHNFPGYANVHVGMQTRRRPPELLNLQPADVAEVTWTIDCEVNGSDVRGPYIQGRPGDRFIYLDWGSAGGNGRLEMFRRAKLMLDGVPAEVLAEAAQSGLLVGRLKLTDAKGQPLCAAVRPPVIEWSVG